MEQYWYASENSPQIMEVDEYIKINSHHIELKQKGISKINNFLNQDLL